MLDKIQQFFRTLLLFELVQGMVLEIGDPYEAQIAKDRAEDVRYR